MKKTLFSLAVLALALHADAQMQELASLNFSNQITGKNQFTDDEGEIYFSAGDEFISLEVDENLSTVEIVSDDHSIALASADAGAVKEISGDMYTSFSQGGFDYIEIGGTLHSLGELDGDITRMYQLNAPNSGVVSLLIITQDGFNEKAYKSYYEAGSFSATDEVIEFSTQHINIHDGYLYVLSEDFIRKRSLSESLLNLDESDFTLVHEPNDDVRNYAFNGNLLSYVDDDDLFVTVNLLTGDPVSQYEHGSSIKGDVYAFGDSPDGYFVAATNYNSSTIVIKRYNTAGQYLGSLDFPFDPSDSDHEISALVAYDWSADGSDELLVVTENACKVFSFYGDNLSVEESDLRDFTYYNNELNFFAKSFSGSVYDLSGKKVFSFKGKEKLNFSFLQRGLYFVDISTKEKTQQVKIYVE